MCIKVKHINQGMTFTFAATCPVGQVRFDFHLLLKIVFFIMFHFKSSRTWRWHVKAYFLGQAWMPL